MNAPRTQRGGSKPPSIASVLTTIVLVVAVLFIGHVTLGPSFWGVFALGYLGVILVVGIEYMRRNRGGVNAE